MSNWLRSLIRRRDATSETASPVVELLVLEGVDAGEQFTVDGDEVIVGRRLTEGLRGRGILLRDPTVSARQALIRRRGSGFVMQHIAGATNPTLVDGHPAEGLPLRIGCTIQIGRVRMQVRAAQGMALSHLTHVFGSDSSPGTSGADALAGSEEDAQATQQVRVPDPEAGFDTTEIRPVVSQLGQLIVERGAELAAERSYPIWSTRTTIGRARGSDIQLRDMGISRQHAELVIEDDRIVLVHRSAVNATLLNGCEVLDRELVAHGDLIQLADRVALRVELRRRGERRDEETAAEVRRRTLKQEMEQKLELERRIEQEYSVEGSFLDVDVVNSYGMKAGAARAEHIVVSFERFRAFVGAVVGEFDGQVLNSNGDELMSYFPSTVDAVCAASAILERLSEFNEKQNLLRMPFQFRLGIHTGRSLVDLDQGVSYSSVLDVAGHLQKLAEHDQLLISEQTYAALPEGMPFELAGTMEREGIGYYRLVGAINARPGP